MICCDDLVEQIILTDDYKGNLYNSELDKINDIAMFDTYGIQILEGFIDMEKTIKTLDIIEDGELVDFHLTLHLSESFNLRKLTK